MAIEAGGKCGVVPYDALLKNISKAVLNRPVEPITQDADAACSNHTHRLVQIAKLVVAFSFAIQ